MMISKDSNRKDDEVKACILCFNLYESPDKDALDFSQLYKLCCKYLHSILTKENEKTQLDNNGHQRLYSFCCECFKSAVQLSEMEKKIKTLQKGVSELILMFTFGILHRRETAVFPEGKENNARRKFLQLNISSFSECESWILPDTPDCESSPVVTSNEIPVTEKENLDGQRFPVNHSDVNDNGMENEVEIEDVKIEILPNEEMSLGKAQVNFERPLLNSGTIVSETSNPQPSSSAIRNDRRHNSLFKLTRKTSSKQLPTWKSVFALCAPQKSNVNSGKKLVQSPDKKSGQSHLKPGSKINERSRASAQLLELVSKESSYFPSKLRNSQPSDFPKTLLFKTAAASTSLSKEKVSQLNLTVTKNETLKGNDLNNSNDHSDNANKKGKYKTMPVKCPLCDQMYASKSSLNEHVRSFHRQGTVFQCSVCTKEFTRKGDVNRHMRIHTGQKPYKCTFCDKRFALKFTMTEHIRTHTGERVTCPVCKKEFSCQANLSSHVKSHNVEKPYKCTVCEYSCRYPNTLKTHQTLTHCMK